MIQELTNLDIRICYQKDLEEYLRCAMGLDRWAKLEALLGLMKVLAIEGTGSNNHPYFSVKSRHSIYYWIEKYISLRQFRKGKTTQIKGGIKKKRDKALCFPIVELSVTTSQES